MLTREGIRIMFGRFVIHECPTLALRYVTEPCARMLWQRAKNLKLAFGPNYCNQGGIHLASLLWHIIGCNVNFQDTFSQEFNGFQTMHRTSWIEAVRIYICSRGITEPESVPIEVRNLFGSDEGVTTLTKRVIDILVKKQHLPILDYS